MAWLYLLLAGLMEIGWPLGLKLAQQPGWRWPWVLLALGIMAASGGLLFGRWLGVGLMVGGVVVLKLSG